MNYKNYSNESFNKVTQTKDLFDRIVSPLKLHLEISFGYMIIFNDGYYYQLIENLECLNTWVNNVNTSNIFCARNVTNHFDNEYNFTLWPQEPNSIAMNIYNEYHIWNGITVSKSSKQHTELYWFTQDKTKENWHKFFIRNKPILLEFIKYFDRHKEILHIPQYSNSRLFKFNQGFDTKIVQSKYTREETLSINKIIDSLQLQLPQTKNGKRVTLSPREIEVLKLINRGYTAKFIALKLNISISTVNTHIEHIKTKYDLHFKTDLIKLYEENLLYLR